MRATARRSRKRSARSWTPTPSRTPRFSSATAASADASARILREGVFAINPALFVIITEDSVYGSLGSDKPEVYEAQRLAKRDIALAEGQCQSQRLFGEGEAARISQTGLAEAAVFLQKIKAYGDARLFSLNHLSDQFSKSTQPLVPDRIFITGGKDGEANSLNLLISDKGGIKIAEGNPDLAELEKTIADAQAKAAEAASAKA